MSDWNFDFNLNNDEKALDLIKNNLLSGLLNGLKDLKEILNSLGFTKSLCPVCQSSNVYLIKHHVSYFPERLILVCQNCHAKIHSNEKFFPELTPPNGDSIKFYHKIGESSNE